MTFDWRGYFSLAEQLSRNTDEASHRSSISRAYYYIYHLADSRAKANHYRRSDEHTVHKSLWQYYERNENQDCRKIAVIGQRLLQKRNKADYEDSYPRLSEEMVEVLIKANNCAAVFASLPLHFPEDPPPRTYSF